MAEVRDRKSRCVDFYDISHLEHGCSDSLEKQDHPIYFRGRMITAKPTICAQQPATAAPPASPVSASAAQIAADEIEVSVQYPQIQKQDSHQERLQVGVAHIIIFPTFIAALPCRSPPCGQGNTYTGIVTSGVTRISILVSLRYCFFRFRKRRWLQIIQPAVRLHRLMRMQSQQ